MWFCLNDTATTEFYTYLHTLSLHDALPISLPQLQRPLRRLADPGRGAVALQERQGKQGRARPAGRRQDRRDRRHPPRSEEHTSELQSLMRISYAVFCLKKNTTQPQAESTPTCP